MRYLALAAALVSIASTALADKCIIQGTSIGKFDLNGLRRPKADYTGISNPDGGDISLNFCGAVIEDPIAAGDGTGAYIQDSRGGISLGKYSTTPQYHNGQLSLTYKEGAACPRSNARRSSLIYLQCDKSWSTGDVTLIDSIDDCFYVFTLKTPHACSQTGGFFSAIWSVLVFLFWLALALGAGFFVYTRFIARKASNGFGSDSNGGAVGEAVSFVKDMVVIVGIWSLDTAQNLVSRLRNRSSSSNAYSTSAYNPYAPAPTSTRGGQAPGAGGGADYSSSAWKATTRTGPPEPPAKDDRSGANGGQGNKAREQEETMPGLAGGGSLLEDDDDEEGDNLTMGGTGGIKM
ncbi:hypothetical protein JCM10212_005400 [Sporobolomyces blumeae]